MTAKEVVREVICLFKGGERWAKGTYMRDSAGSTLQDASPQSERAATFCLLGAAHRVLGLDAWQRVRDHEVLREFADLIRESLPKKTRTQLLENGAISKTYDAKSEAYIEDPGDYVVGFNDGSCTTFDQIESVLAKALTRKTRTRKRKAVTA